VDGVPHRIFISHAGRDRAWAEWARWHLESAGHPTGLDTVDWAPGTNFVEAMHKALHRDNPLLVLLSAAYLGSDRYTVDEWTARFAQRRRDPEAKLIPLRIDDVDLSGGLWAPIVVPSVFDLPSDQAVALLLDAVRRVVAPSPGGRSPTVPPAFPGRAAVSADGPRPPGSLPAVWNLARRNPGFTGRDEMLNRLHDKLSTGNRVTVHALHGTGGVGKTQLALEYAHRFAGEYDLVWWIPSEKPELIGDHLAALAQDPDLCLAPAGTSTPDSVRALRGHLRRTGRWLLIFDNAEAREHLTRWLPDGPGHLLITSRNPIWTGVAHEVDVDVFSRSESVALLSNHLPHLGEGDADRLAEALGDLPLAVAQAMELLAETRMPVDDYLTELADHVGELMSEGNPPAGYPLSLAATVTLTAGRLCDTDPAAGELLYLCARLGPEIIPADLFTAHPHLLPRPLEAVAQKPVAFRRTMAQLGRLGLARLTDAGPILHRLVQAVLRDTDPDRDTHRDIVEGLLVADQPDDGTHPQGWPRWSVLLPHILAVDPATTTNARLRVATSHAVWSVMARGEARTALALAEDLYQAWNRRYGPDERTTGDIAHVLAVAHSRVGHHQAARDLHEERFIRTRQLFGDDDLLTLNAAHGFAEALSALGDTDRSRRILEDTLARRRRILGEDHLYTLSSASSLATSLSRLGEHERARKLEEDTLARRRRVLGDDYPDTLVSANKLAVFLSRLGEYERAREMDQDTLARRRRVLGDRHPFTVTSAHNLADNLDALGRGAEADEVRRSFPPEEE
jgi:hypothetical protein